jgi:hypothetical protein
MSARSAKHSKAVGAYETKTKLPGIDHSVFTRLRALHSQVSLGKAGSAKDLITAGRRI